MTSHNFFSNLVQMDRQQLGRHVLFELAITCKIYPPFGTLYLIHNFKSKDIEEIRLEDSRGSYTRLQKVLLPKS